jgi:PST family polysaccharide transporter
MKPDQPALFTTQIGQSDCVTQSVANQARVEALQSKAKWGAVVLVLRLAILQLVVLGGEISLRRELAPGDFGLFAIVQFALTFFTFFGDAGLGGALIQKKDEPTQRQLSSIWVFQMLASLALVVLIWISAPLILKVWPDVDKKGVWLLRALSIAMLLTASRTVPMLLMERHLQFGRMSALDVLLSVSFYVTAVLLVHFHFGVVALVGAVLVQGALSTVGAFLLRRWRPSLIIDWRELSPVLRFGASYQLKNLLGFTASAIAPIYGGRMLGQAGLGFINWAQSTAYFPLKLVEVMSRVSFPLYSRLQDDARSFARAFDRSLQISCLGNLFFMGLALGIGPNLVRIVYTAKWLPGLPLFYVFVTSISIGFFAPLAAPAFDAIGKPQILARFSVGWTVGVLLLVSIATPKWGALGYVFGSCNPMVVGNALLMALVAKKFPKVRLWHDCRASLAGSVVIALLGKTVIVQHIEGAFTLIIAVLGLAVVFLGIVALLDREFARSLIPMVKSRKLLIVDNG